MTFHILVILPASSARAATPRSHNRDEVSFCDPTGNDPAVSNLLTFIRTAGRSSTVSFLGSKKKHVSAGSIPPKANQFAFSRITNKNSTIRCVFVLVSRIVMEPKLYLAQ